MFRSIVIVLVGALIGSAAAFWRAGGGPPAAPAVIDFTGPVGRTGLESSRSRLHAALERLGTEAADLSDAAMLELEISRIAAALPSARGELMLEALLVRLVEVDPSRAVGLVQTLGLGRRYFVPVLRRWAEVDPDAALAALGALDHPGLVSALALELLEVIGDNAEGIDRIAALLPASNRINFELAALMHRVGRDPVSALTGAVALEDPIVRDTALQRIAFAWGNRDGRAAMAELNSIPDRGARNAYYNMVLTWWARNDPLSALQYAVNSDDEYLLASMTALGTLANRLPAEMIALSDQLPPSFRTDLRTFAMNVLADQDPAEALATAVTMPPGPERETYIARTAGQLARQDPAAAIAWARGQPNSRELMAPILGAMLQVDFDLSVDLAFQNLDNPALLQTIAAGASRYPDRIPDLADRLLASGGAQSPDLSTLLGGWADSRPSLALNWALANGAVLDANLTSRLAAGFAATDIDAAMTAMSRVPNDHRASWLRGAANAYAQRDAAGAMRWIEEYRGQPGYDAAAAAVIVRLASNDPVTAAGIVGELTGSAQLVAVRTVASAWADQDPAAAGRWAAALADPAVRAAALEQIAAAP